MNEIDTIRAALVAFGSAPEPFFTNNLETFTKARMALVRLEKILEALDE